MKKISTVIMIGFLCFSMFTIFAPNASASSDLLSLPSEPYGWQYADSSHNTLMENPLAGYLVSVSEQSISASPGQTVSVSVTYQVFAQSPPNNPSEIDQLFFVESWTAGWPPQGYTIPLYNGIPGLSPGVTQTNTISFTVPTVSGTYYLWLCFEAQYSMQDAVNQRTLPMNGLPGHIKVVVTPTAAPVGYWKFDEGSGNIAHDSSGNGNNGIIHTATWTTGIIGSALHFNGVDSWVEILNSPTLTGLSQITLEAWIQEDSITAQLKGIISKCDGSAPPTNAEYFLGTNENGRVFFETDNGVAIFSSQTTPLITEAGRWYHVAGTWSGDSYAIYVDGTQVFSGACTPQTTLSNTLPVQIGRHGTWSWVYFQGIIDEVKIYNYARTGEEIQNDYASVECIPRVLLMDGFPLGPLDRGTGQSFWDYDWSFPNGSKFTVRGFLQSKGFSVDVSSQVLGSNPVTLAVLSGYDVVILSATYFDIPANVPYQGVFVDYVSQGGGLLLLGQADVSWVTLDDALGFHFVTIQWWNYYVDARITDPSHPIMSGISELPKAGGVFVDWDTLIADGPLPPNTAVLARSVGSGGMYDPDNVIALIAFQHGQGKVVVGPLDGMIRPYGPTAVDGFDVISEPVIENRLLINTINWVSQAIVNEHPVADFRYRGPKTSFTPSTIYVGSDVKFDAEPSYDPDGTIISYAWNFGDGTTITETDQVAYHAYPISGPYTVTLTVTDDKGSTASISEDIFINPLRWEIYFEIDYMTGHKPTDSVLEYIHGYFRDNGIYIYFFVDDEISPADPSVTRNEFWQYEATYNDAWKFDDRANGDITKGKYKLKEKWILFGTASAESATASGYSVAPNTEYGNYIFIADQANDQWVSSRPISTSEVETVALMHEIGHTIGILLEDKRGTDPDGDGTSENYDNTPWSVMALLTASNCIVDPIRYSPRYWKEKNLDYYII